ncbi:MAG TPA: hypothetical protein VFC85_10045 [Verrucomicrobiae bacterium]|nr:hypothetical protein [Verrucomicrobiae bacterium]
MAMLSAAALGLAGCSGINAGTTVSPASFFLPGLLRNDAPAHAPVAPPEISKEFAVTK